MEFHNLIAALPGKKSAVYTFERGKAVRHPHAGLHEDTARVREDLRAWGVKAGTRVGIYAPNSYHWLVHDIALIGLGAIFFLLNQALISRPRKVMAFCLLGVAALTP